MIDAATQTRLQHLFSREHRSLLQYISQATPWCRECDRPLLEKITSLAVAELAALRRMGEWMDANRIALPYLGAFPTAFTSYNFVDIRKLVKPLEAEQRKELADLERETSTLSEAEPRNPVKELVELNRTHLALLQSL
jgi:hypothetical protein